MENFVREATEDTPYIFFDAENDVLNIKGISYPEDHIEFFEPMFQWLDGYFPQLNLVDLRVNLEIVYFHSGSTKILLYFFDKLVEEAKKGTNITVNWIYEVEEKDMLLCGEQFQRDFKELHFHFVQKLL